MGNRRPLSDAPLLCRHELLQLVEPVLHQDQVRRRITTFRLDTLNDHEPPIRSDVVRPATESDVHCRFKQHLRTPGDECRRELNGDRKDLPVVRAAEEQLAAIM